jgi:hypothetical protein
MREVVLEVSGLLLLVRLKNKRHPVCFIVVIASVGTGERGGQGHTSASLLYQFATRRRAGHNVFLYECFFDIVFRIVCDGWQN